MSIEMNGEREYLCVWLEDRTDSDDIREIERISAESFLVELGYNERGRAEWNEEWRKVGNCIYVYPDGGYEWHLHRTVSGLARKISFDELERMASGLHNGFKSIKFRLSGNTLKL